MSYPPYKRRKYTLGFNANTDMYPSYAPTVPMPAPMVTNPYGAIQRMEAMNWGSQRYLAQHPAREALYMRHAMSNSAYRSNLPHLPRHVYDNIGSFLRPTQHKNYYVGKGKIQQTQRESEDKAFNRFVTEEAQRIHKGGLMARGQQLNAEFTTLRNAVQPANVELAQARENQLALLNDEMERIKSRIVPEQPRAINQRIAEDLPNILPTAPLTEELPPMPIAIPRNVE